VITGFRVALGGAQALLGVVPDLAIFGKAVAGGFPLSVVAGKRELIEEVDRGRVVHAGTFNGNPIVLSAARATLDVLARENGAILNRAAEYGEKVVTSLRQLASEHRVPLRVHGHGTVFHPIFGGPQLILNYRGFASADARATQEFVVELFHQGVYCVPDGRWYVSGVHGESELSFLQDALAMAFRHFAGQFQR
jgi:glutamate-1-semialdehyde 2,1-aminomutase